MENNKSTEAQALRSLSELHDLFAGMERDARQAADEAEVRRRAYARCAAVVYGVKQEWEAQAKLKTKEGSPSPRPSPPGEGAPALDRLAPDSKVRRAVNSFAGMRFTPLEADWLHDQIAARATLPPID